VSLFGYGRDELLGQPVERLLPERFRTGHPRLRAWMPSPASGRRRSSSRPRCRCSPREAHLGPRRPRW
jgi:hypothetical protein